MNQRFFAAAFAIGLLAVGWVGFGFAGSNWLALTMTAAIAAVYLLGAFELRQFRAANAGLAAALAEPVTSLTDWLERVPVSLRHAVRLRVEGERSGLPGPALTPYLVGLLVMLGMLGTFLGMVVTFKGAVFALEGSSDLQAMRSALAEPIKGLGLAFGTSVAGVAASAMLGLMSAISRRERMEAGRLLDQRIATVLRPFSLVHQRGETFRALQLQAGALPAVADKLDALIERIEQRQQRFDAQLLERQQQLDAQLLQRQADFHREVTLAYTELARGVGVSLQESLAVGARAAGESIQPVVAAAMTQFVQEARQLHAGIAGTAQAQVDDLSQQFEQRSAALLGAVNEGVAQSQSHAVHMLARSEELVRSRVAGEALWLEQHGQRMEQLAALWGQQFETLRREESARGEAAVARLGELQAAVARHLATLGAALEAPITRLLQTAAEVPEAAAGVLAQLRQEMSRVAESDNLALRERTLLLENIGALLREVTQASGEQRAAIETLVASAGSVLEQAGQRFTQALDAQAGHAADMSTQLTASALELASLGEAFGQGVQAFQASNEKLVESLQRIEGSIDKSSARSDEQLAYYVAQAREVIDLSIASQQGLVDHLRQLQARPLTLATGTHG